MVEAVDLTKTYGAKRGVQNVSFTIGDGEIVGLLGPNGAGKSTIMRMLAGYNPPTSGSVSIGGVDLIGNPREASEKIGFLSEVPALYEEMPVEDFLLFLGRIRGVGKKELKAHVHGIMERCAVANVSQRLIRNLSKGYRQRVGFAQALVGDPCFLILDEPTAGLDPKQITEVRSLIKKLSDSHTIIISSHILSEISAICEKVMILHEGNLVLDSRISDLSGTGRDTFLLRLKADAERAHTALSGIEAVIEITPQEAKCEGAVEFIISAKPGMDVRDSIFMRCCEAGLPILEMRTAGETLEELFLRLTGTREGGE